MVDYTGAYRKSLSRSWWILFIITSVLLVSIGGCSKSYVATGDTLKHAFKSLYQSKNYQLDPNLSYLRVTNGDHVAFLALGYIDEENENKPSAVEVWYSAEKEVLRLKNGRLVGLTGTEIELRNTFFFDLPVWKDIEDPQTFTLVQDQMPGSWYKKSTKLTISRIAKPGNVKLLNVSKEDLIWFEEKVVGGDNSMSPSKYGVRIDQGKYIPIYGEQCLAKDFCLTWQKWAASDNQDA